MKWTWWTSTLAFAVGLAATSAALAAGGPVPPVQGSGIAAPGSPYQYAAFATGLDTTVKRFERGAVSALRVQGRYGVPAVDYRGSTTGLSAGGRTLVLAEMPRSVPPRTTRLLVLAAAPRLAVRTRLTLPGWWTVDAISPDGRWLYLIQYPSSDISQYAVRAYDLPAHRLLAEPVVDPRERDEAMTGFPVMRVMSPGDRWAYTLYFRPSGAPFVHALDTVHRRAVCVDLPSLSSTDVGNGRLRLTPDRGTLQVVVDGVTAARIDTRTFVVATGAGNSASVPTRPAARVGALAAAVTLPARPKRTDGDPRSPESPAPVRPEHVGTGSEPQPQPGPWTFST